MKMVGYARVSTEAQDLISQLDALERAQCAPIYSDKAGGARTNRPGLESALEALSTGDTLVVYRLDRLARNVRHLIELSERFQEGGIRLVSLSENIDTSGAAGKLYFHIIAAFAQMERELIRERTKAGLEAARARGRVGGRPRAMADYKLSPIEDALRKGVPMRDIATEFDVSVPTIYRYFRVGKLRPRTSGEK